MRNEIAVDAIVRYAATNDVVAIWGAGHITGMLSLLGDSGFIEEKKEWLTAWTPPKVRLLDVLRAEKESADKEESR
jgi:pheromone shutdown protein TraB